MRISGISATAATRTCPKLRVVTRIYRKIALLGVESSTRAENSVRAGATNARLDDPNAVGSRKAELVQAGQSANDIAPRLVFE